LSVLGTGRFYARGSIPDSYLCWRLSRHRHSAAGKITSTKFPMAPSGVEPANFSLVAQRLNVLRYLLYGYSKTLDKSDTVRREDSLVGYGEAKVMLIFEARTSTELRSKRMRVVRPAVLPPPVPSHVKRHSTWRGDCLISRACNRHRTRILRQSRHLYIITTSFKEKDSFLLIIVFIPILKLILIRIKDICEELGREHYNKKKK
jgi:hypothetical protein